MNGQADFTDLSFVTGLQHVERTDSVIMLISQIPAVSDGNRTCKSGKK